jgi:predicted peptidase
MSRIFTLLLLLAFPALAFAKKETGFLDRVVKVDGTEYRYVVYVPHDWTKSKKWPTVLFLHGSGERGDDGLAQSQVGLPGAVRLHPDRFPFIIVMPQCRIDHWWTEPAMIKVALKALDDAMKEFKGDPQQVHLTGLSMGGWGTWTIAATHPGKFATITPVCAGVLSEHDFPPASPAADPYADIAAKIGKTPVWIFHGDADPAVPVENSRKMNAALKAAGGNVKYTEYEGVGHDSWNKAYWEAELPKWWLAQRWIADVNSLKK